MPDVSTVMLNNGVELPGLGLGVFQTPTDETRAAVAAAISAGYRHIDTAAAYGNEREVGEAVRSSGLDRSEVFLETKIWISDYRYDKTLRGFGKSARKLGVDQIDLLILHQACRRTSRRPWMPTGPWRRCWPTGGCERSGSALHGGAPHRAARAQHCGAGCQPDRDPPLLPAKTSAGLRRRAWHLGPGLVPDRRHHLLPRRAAQQHLAGSGDRRHRRPTTRLLLRSCCAGTCSGAAR